MNPKNSINPINQLTLLLFVLDPYYSQSHKVTMIETGIDTRVFRTETPAVNMDDDPDNDIPYDTFEIKLNYPLPYPQIIEEIGESGERIMADSAEIEYLKKNDTIVNDYDEDGEITEEERLHFPVWQGPDYTEREQNPYLISNMIFNQNDCAPLDQTEFIADDSKFYVKVNDSTIRDTEIEAKIYSYFIENGQKIITDEKIITLTKTKASQFLSDRIVIVKDMEEKRREEDNPNSGILDNIKLFVKDLKYSVIAIQIINDEDIKKEEDIKGYGYFIEAMRSKKSEETPTIAQYADIVYKSQAMIKLINKNAKINMNLDRSPTKSKIRDYLKNNNLSIFHVEGHGQSFGSEYGTAPGIFVYVEENLISNARNALEDSVISIPFFASINKSNREIGLTFFNTCFSIHTGNVGEKAMQKMMKALNTKLFMGWEETVDNGFAQVFAIEFYRNLEFKGVFPTFDEVNAAKGKSLDILDNIFPEDFYAKYGHKIQVIENSLIK